jgi:hypothetical protein
VKSLRLISALALSTMPYLGEAQTARVGGCDEKREQCVSECRARMFSIDPRRSVCLETCAEEVTTCARSVEAFCKVGNRCQ